MRDSMIRLVENSFNKNNQRKSGQSTKAKVAFLILATSVCTVYAPITKAFYARIVWDGT